MNWFLYALCGAILYAIAEIIGKYVADEKSEPVLLSILGTGFAAIIGFLVAFISKQIIIHPTPAAITGLIISSFVYAIGCITYYAALKSIDISEFVLFTRTQTIIIFIGGLLLFKEVFQIQQIIGTMCIVSGAVIMSWRKHKIKIGKGVLLALVTSVLFGIGSLIDKAIINNFSASFYTSVNYAVTTLLLIIPALSVVRSRNIFPQK